MKIVNLTQHDPTAEQAAEGVFDFSTGEIRPLLNFDSLPERGEITARAQALAAQARASGAEAALVGGAPFLMEPLCAALREAGVRPLFAFSRRESAEETLPDGSVRKVAVFRHAGWIPA